MKLPGDCIPHRETGAAALTALCMLCRRGTRKWELSLRTGIPWWRVERWCAHRSIRNIYEIL